MLFIELLIRDNKDYKELNTLTSLLWTEYTRDKIKQQITFIGKKTNLITWSTGEIKKKKKNGACVFLSTVFFLSFLAGKFWIVKQPIINSFSRSNKIAISTFAYTPQNWRTSVSLNSSDPREKGSTSVLYLWINTFTVFLVWSFLDGQRYSPLNLK